MRKSLGLNKRDYQHQPIDSLGGAVSSDVYIELPELGGNQEGDHQGNGSGAVYYGNDEEESKNDEEVIDCKCNFAIT